MELQGVVLRLRTRQTFVSEVSLIYCKITRMAYCKTSRFPPRSLWIYSAPSSMQLTAFSCAAPTYLHFRSIASNETYIQLLSGFAFYYMPSLFLCVPTNLNDKKKSSFLSRLYCQSCLQHSRVMNSMLIFECKICCRLFPNESLI